MFACCWLATFNAESAGCPAVVLTAELPLLDCMPLISSAAEESGYHKSTGQTVREHVPGALYFTCKPPTDLTQLCHFQSHGGIRMGAPTMQHSPRAFAVNQLRSRLQCCMPQVALLSRRNMPAPTA